MYAINWLKLFPGRIILWLFPLPVPLLAVRIAKSIAKGERAHPTLHPSSEFPVELGCLGYRTPFSAVEDISHIEGKTALSLHDIQL